MSWEYLRLQCEVHEIRSSDGQVEALGRDGWELIAVVDAAHSYLHFWFKRPVQTGTRR